MLQGVLLTLIAEGIALPAGLITAIVLTRGLGPESYGSYVVVATTVAMTEWLLIAVLARAVVKFVAEADDWRSVATTALHLYMLAGVALAAGFWLLAPLLATALRDPLLGEYFRLFAPQIAIFAVGAGCRNVLAGQARYREQAAASAVAWLGRLAFIVLFVKMGWGVEGAILGSVSGTLVGSLAAAALTRVPLIAASSFPAKKLMQLAIPAFIAMLAARLLDQVGLLALQVLATGDAEVGLYGAAMNVMLLTGVIAAAVSPVLISSISSARHGGNEEAVMKIASGTLRFGIALLPFAFIVVGASDEMVDLLFGPAFAGAAPLMALLIVAAVARAGIALTAALYIALGNAWIAAAVATPLPGVALVAHAILIPRLGAFGAAAVSAVVSLVGAAISLIVAARMTHGRLPMQTVARSTVLAGLAWAAAALWPTPGATVLLKAAVLVLAVVAGFLLTGELDREELAQLRRSASIR